MRWKIDECPDAEGNWTLREDDGTEHGNTETCIATVYGGEQEQNLIESAPLLAEQVRILRGALEKLRDCVREIPCNNYTPSLHDAAVMATKVLEATKKA